MKSDKGITMIALAAMLVILMIIATITMYYGNSAIKEAKLQDLKTNMLLIQANLKNDLEKYHFETNNLSAEEKESKKSEYLKGKKLSDPLCEKAKTAFDKINTNSQIEKKVNEDYQKVNGEFEYYYLDSSILKQIGLNDVKSDEEDGYYIVAYSMNPTYSNIVEVINTKGYLGNYTLCRIELL